MGDAIQSRFEIAKIAHLAYVPKIARSMVCHQRAGAVVLARQRMVQGSLKELEGKIVLLMSGQRAMLVAKMIAVLLLGSGAQLIFQMSQASQ